MPNPHTSESPAAVRGEPSLLPLAWLAVAMGALLMVGCGGGEPASSTPPSEPVVDAATPPASALPTPGSAHPAQANTPAQATAGRPAVSPTPLTPTLQQTAGQQEIAAPLRGPAETPQQRVAIMNRAAREKNWQLAFECFDTASGNQLLAMLALEARQFAMGDPAKRAALRELLAPYQLELDKLRPGPPGAMPVDGLADVGNKAACYQAVANWLMESDPARAKAMSPGEEMDLFLVEIKGDRAEGKVAVTTKVTNQTPGQPPTTFTRKQGLPIHFVKQQGDWKVDMLATVAGNLEQTKEPELPAPGQVQLRQETATAAIETYCAAMLGRDWKTAVQTLNRPSQVSETARILFLGLSHGRGDSIEQVRAVAKKYGLSPLPENQTKKLAMLEDPTLCYIDLMQVIQEVPSLLTEFYPPWQFRNPRQLGEVPDKVWFLVENPEATGLYRRGRIYPLASDAGRWTIDLTLVEQATMDYLKRQVKDDPAQLLSIPLEGVATALEFSPSGRMLAIIERSEAGAETVAIYGLPGGKLLRTLELQEFFPAALRFSPAGDLLAVGGTPQTPYGAEVDNDAHPGVLLFDAKTGKLARPLRGQPGEVEALAFSADGQTLATGCRSRRTKAMSSQIFLWDVASGRQKSVIPLGSLSREPTFDTHATTAVSIERNQATIWSPATGKAVREINLSLMHNASIYDVALSPDGSLLCTDNSVIWDVATGKPRRALAEQERLSHAGITPNGRFVVGANGWDAQVWDVTTGQLVRSLSGHKGPLSDVEIDRGGGLLATGGHDKTLRIWRLDP